MSGRRSDTWKVGNIFQVDGSLSLMAEREMTFSITNGPSHVVSSFFMGRLILGWEMQAQSEVDIDPETYNTCPSSLVAEPKDFL